MRNRCKCEMWQSTVGNHFDGDRGIEANVPMYFGRIIYHCPWCGRLLSKEEEGNE